MSVIIKTDQMEIDNTGYWITVTDNNNVELGFHQYHNPKFSEKIDNLLAELAGKAHVVGELIRQESIDNPMSDEQVNEYQGQVWRQEGLEG